MALIRLVLIGFVVLSVIYVALSLYARLKYRRHLGREWDDERPTDNRAAYVKQGMAEYDDSYRPKLILGVYIIPVCVVIVIVYLTNFY